MIASSFSLRKNMVYRNPYFEKTDENPEYEAGKVLSEIDWDGTLPVDVLTICEMYGIEYVFGSDPSMREEGTTRFRGEGDFYIFINTFNSDCPDGFSGDQTKRRRQRFTFAHELAHCIYKSHTDLQLQQNLSNKNNPHSRTYTRIREDQANQFSAHLLVPKKAFQQFSRQVGWTDIAKLIQKTADKFDVSLEVAAQQIARLANYPCITILFDNNGNPKRVPVYSRDFQETKLFYHKNQIAPEGTLAAQISCDLHQTQKVKKFSDASIWFPDEADWKTRKFSIVETSIKKGKYGTLTFLEIDEVER
jgi:hypothetical protein